VSVSCFNHRLPRGHTHPEVLQACSQHVLHDVRVRQVQLEERFALLSAVKDVEVSEAAALERLERSPQ
jgi:hypothetical protein